MKKTIFIFCLLFLICSNIFSQEYKVEKNDNNDWIFNTSFQLLYKKKVWEEIQIQNNSTKNLNHIICSVQIKNKEHKMKPISSIKSGDKEEFEGYEDDEMKDEFPYYFGADGKFTFNNTNKITFKINFKENYDDIIISTVYMNNQHLLFIIEDAPDINVETEHKSLESVESQIIIIDGQKYFS